MKGILSFKYVIYGFEVFIQSPRKSRAVPTVSISAPDFSHVFSVLCLLSTMCIQARGQNASLFIVSERQWHSRLPHPKVVVTEDLFSENEIGHSAHCGCAAQGPDTSLSVVAERTHSRVSSSSA